MGLLPAEDEATATMVCGGGADGLPDVGANASAAPLNILLQEDLGLNSIGKKIIAKIIMNSLSKSYIKK